MCENVLIRHCEGGHVRRSLGVGGTTEAIFYNQEIASLTLAMTWLLPEDSPPQAEKHSDYAKVSSDNVNPTNIFSVIL